MRSAANLRTPPFLTGAGNLLYSVKPHDIEDMLADNGFGEFEQIHVSLDPVSGRNPGYCFVDFLDKATAGRALASLSATIAGRPLKVGPCEPKKGGGDRRPGGAKPTSQRWGDWRASTGGGQAAEGSDDLQGLQGPRAALKHFNDVIGRATVTKRVYLGGLGRMENQAQSMAEVQGILAGFNPWVTNVVKPETRLTEVPERP